MDTVYLRNKNGMSVDIINYGARVKSIKFPVNGEPTEMTVGHTLASDYLNDPFYLGACCGRVCNRVSAGEFQLDNKIYKLSQNEGKNCLHGGEDNFSYRFWLIEENSKTQATLSLVSESGDQGFPGTLKVNVQFKLSEDNKFSVEYSATTSAATPINLTNHAYFNLGEKSCELLSLQIMSSAIVEFNKNHTPTGKIIDVRHADFREQTSISIHKNNKENREVKPINHCFILDNVPFKQAKAVLISHENKVKLSVYTDQPALQLYTGSLLSGSFNAYQGICLETQNYTDAINFKHFPNSVLRPNEQYNRVTIFAFEYTG